MSSGTGSASNAKPGPSSKQGQGTFSAVNSHAILLDKLNRRSTPDSEALASSDDEADSHRQDPPQQAQPQKPVRRASWLNDTTQPLPRPRKGSFASSSMSPTASHPSTPSAEGNAPWGTHTQSSGLMGRAPVPGASFTWGTGIWNNERKDPPSRLSEVLPSPTSTMPPGSAGGSFFNPDNYGQTSPAPRDSGPNAQIPFAIPLHPTPKTYRSQSYSVGQLEPDAPPAAMSSSTILGRGRAHGHSGLQHRPSRPSMLSEMSNEGGLLGKVKELDEANDGSEMAAKRALGRRMSEFGASGFRSPYENRKLENVKKAFWHSSLGFGGPEGQQSRRHSFADIPTRQGSISSINESFSALDTPVAEQPQTQDYSLAYSENQNYPLGNTAAFFTPGGGLAAPPQSMQFNNNFPSAYSMHPPYGNRAPSPHRNVYAMSQPRHNQLLHIVLFKCARADVFYIQEGTGLSVKPGDLVIVEADRGTDLGTVARDNVDWQTAKELKEHYAEEQYKWLMMYSQNAAAAQDGTGAGLMAAANGLQGSAVGGMGPPNQHGHMQEPNAGELKPKLIKRLAQSHEIHALRDKEGNEAKAKRVCMQKVKEHGLNMEILDAEFQMDWKKLTFYYFADSYINFNSLVTDLFKIYKTRIWMSAINPASFASPTLGIQAPSGVGPGAVGVGRGGSNNSERRTAQQQQQQNQDQHSGGFGGSGPPGRGFQNSFTPPFGERPGGPAGGYGQPNYPYSHMGGMGTAPRPGNLPYVPGVLPSLDSYSFPGAADYQMRSRFQPGTDGPGPHESGVGPINTQSEWATAFQGLSLNSR
ncbi:hypothetical protein CSAL01_09165 [Colletotrichum salicis]|uniref:PSP1 C-terminal domain-containing protein n=1 Tax=Colletotrichum salicis TaxID=1209931 RepID=A0A135V0J6_9PEZI|nr:hypothetical protein CSAL01_09165 [Colletotrichum salicis]